MINSTLTDPIEHMFQRLQAAEEPTLQAEEDGGRRLAGLTGQPLGIEERGPRAQQALQVIITESALCIELTMDY